MFKKTHITSGITSGITAGMAASLFLFAQPAAARPASEQSANTEAVQHLVQYADLDLSSAKDRAKLDARLRRAANAVCDISYGAHPLTEVMAANRCYRSALQAAHRQVASLRNTRMVSR